MQKRKFISIGIDLLYPAIVKSITSFCAYVDSMALFYACPTLYHNIDLKALISKKLQELQHDPIWIFDILHRSNGALTGYFLLWCITGDRFWKPHSFDIVTCNDVSELLQNQFPLLKDDIKQIVTDAESAKKTNLGTFLSFDFKEHTFMKHDLSTNLEFIFLKCHLDFGKIAFDGNRLSVFNWNVIWQRSCEKHCCGNNF